MCMNQLIGLPSCSGDCHITNGPIHGFPGDSSPLSAGLLCDSGWERYLQLCVLYGPYPRLKPVLPQSCCTQSHMITYMYRMTQEAHKIGCHGSMYYIDTFQDWVTHSVTIRDSSHHIPGLSGSFYHDEGFILSAICVGTQIWCHGPTRYTGSGVTFRHESKRSDAMNRHGMHCSTRIPPGYYFTPWLCVGIPYGFMGAQLAYRHRYHAQLDTSTM